MSEAVKLVEAEDILAQMRLGTKETYDIRLRGYSFPVRVLSIDEEIEIRKGAITENKKMFGDEVSLAAMVQKQTLKTASHITGSATAVPNSIWDSLKRDELVYLYNEYMKIVEDVNPSLEQVQPDEFRALVEAIKKKAVTANDLSLAQLRAVFYSFQELILELDSQRSQKDNSSGGPS